jgi:ribosomal protein S18 acetylase RimI-like enzyme
MTSVLDTSVLDNVVWHAIEGQQGGLAERVGLAGRFYPEVSPFAGIRDTTPEAWADLGRLVGPGKATILFGPQVPGHDEWVPEHRIPCLQLVATDVTDRASIDDFVELGPSDVPEMVELVEATRPGPFGPRTIEFGRYIGCRSDGRLVAMSGERFRCPGFTEVSAVCTTEDHRGRGLARELVLATIEGIRERGDEAFLHVASDNTPAITLYLAMGFTLRCEAEAVIVRHTKDS